MPRVGNAARRGGRGDETFDTPWKNEAFPAVTASDVMKVVEELPPSD